MLIKLQQESNEAEAALKRTSGTLFYLQNLQKSGGTELDPCPVCKESLKEKVTLKYFFWVHVSFHS